jgi:hypothetical protein
VSEGIEEVPPTSLTRGPEMSNGTAEKRQSGRPESEADRSRDMGQLNQQVVCSDPFGGGGGDEDFLPASPKVERSPSGASIDHKLHFVGLSINRTCDHFGRLRITRELRDRTRLDLQRAADAVANIRKMAKIGAGHRVGNRIMKIFLRA